MRIILKILKWIGILILVLIVLLVALLFWLSKKPFVPTNYTKTVKTGDTLEAKYLAMGAFEVSQIQADALDDWKTYSIYYPTILETNNTAFPVVVVVNGTGVAASKYPALFQHLASWGFIVIGNEDPSTCSGDSADASLAYLLRQNDISDSIFYQKIDTVHIGITGHSQGGVGVFNAISTQPHGKLYTCAVSLSPTQLEVADAIGLHYEPNKITIPTLLLAADANDVITSEGVASVYNAIPARKFAALHTGVDHGKMLYWCDGYVTAWFLWHLMGDEDAAKAFTGDTPEFFSNPLYTNQQTDL